jgi:hypothetical protein
VNKPKDDFTKAELAELFGEPKKGRKYLPRRLDKKAMAKSDAPFLADTADKAFVKPKEVKVNRDVRRNSIKVLTILRPLLIMPSTINRKDDKVATKAKIQTNYMQTSAVCLLAAGAILGLADMLGGGFKACLVATLLVACLFVMAVDYRK